MACKKDCDDCESRSSSLPACLTGFVRYAKHYCYTIGDGVINLYCALKDIATAIREYTDKVSEKGYASGILQFTMESGTDVDPNDITELQFSRTPFNFKVLGIGASTIDFNDCGGQYFLDSILEIKFWDYTSNKQIGNTLTLRNTQLNDQHTDEGMMIDDNIFTGHIYGVKVQYINEEGASCELPKIDFYFLVTPVEITTEE